MREIPLQDIIIAHTSTLAAHSVEFLPMIRVLLLLGEGPVSPGQLATAMHWMPWEVEAFLLSSGLMVDVEGGISRWEPVPGVRLTPCWSPC